MLSDSCFQAVDDILQAITDYDYSDDFKNKLMRAIMELYEIKDDLDHCGQGKLLKNDRKESIRIAAKLFENAQRKRDNCEVEFYDDIYD